MNLKNKPPLSRAQREVMEIIWDRGEVGVLEVTETINQDRAVARNTVRTLMERMVGEQKIPYRSTLYRMGIHQF